jgi:hypothetical protein
MAPNYLTQADVENYGSELLDVSQRAAMQAVAPYLQNLEQQNAQLWHQQAREQRRALDERVAAAVPNFREVDRDPRWHQWLIGVDLMSGRVRQSLLNEAINSGDAQRVQLFFKQFQQQGGQTSTSASAPRRTRSATSKPFYTHNAIKQLYEAHRKGAYVGREAEWARQEQDIFAAQREGRVEYIPYLTK